MLAHNAKILKEIRLLITPRPCRRFRPGCVNSILEKSYTVHYYRY